MATKLAVPINETPNLRDGIDEGAALTAKGRLKRIRCCNLIAAFSTCFLSSYNREDEDDSFDIDDDALAVTYRDANIAQFQFKQRSFHIRRAFDLFGNIHAIMNDGMKRHARELDGEDATDIQ